jgi:hypothetical protein
VSAHHAAGQRAGHEPSYHLSQLYAAPFPLRARRRRGGFKMGLEADEELARQLQREEYRLRDLSPPAAAGPSVRA